MLFTGTLPRTSLQSIDCEDKIARPLQNERQ